MKRWILSLGFLFMGSAAFAANADITVPVPDDFAYGQIVVNGTAGTNQTASASATLCTTAITAYGNCHGTAVDLPLNQAVSVSVGFYEVTYANSVNPTLVQVTKNQTTVVNLQKIQVPKAPGQITFNVYLDLTDAGEQAAWLRNEINTQYTTDGLSTWCKAHASNPGMTNLCANQNAFSVLYQFGKDASCSYLNPSDDDKSASYVNAGRLSVADPNAGDFLSVLPGVYLIEFKDATSGKIVDDYGVVVR